MTPVTTKKKRGGYELKLAKILRYIVEFYTAFLILNKQQNKLMVITSNCVGEEDRHRWNVKHGYKFGGGEMLTSSLRSTWTLTCNTFVSLLKIKLQWSMKSWLAVRRSYIDNDTTSWLVTRIMTQFVGTQSRTLELKWCGYTKIMSSRKSSI